MVNYIAVLVSGLAGFALGGLWYSPLLFSKPWARLAGIKTEQPGSMMWLRFLAQAIVAIVMALVLSFFVSPTQGAWSGVTAGVFLWFGFVFTTTIGMILWENKPAKLWAITSGYYLLELMLMGAILGSWR